MAWSELSPGRAVGTLFSMWRWWLAIATINVFVESTAVAGALVALAITIRGFKADPSEAQKKKEEAAAGKNEGEAAKALLDYDTFFIREHVGITTLSDTYDILDPATQRKIGFIQEKPGKCLKLLRCLNKVGAGYSITKLFPSTFQMFETLAGPGPDGQKQKLIFTLRKPCFWGKWTVTGTDDQLIGVLQQPCVPCRTCFKLADADGGAQGMIKAPLCCPKEFTFRDESGASFGTVTKKWSGLAKELFTTADNFVIAFTSNAAGSKHRANLKVLMLAGGVGIDAVYFE